MWIEGAGRIAGIHGGRRRPVSARRPGRAAPGAVHGSREGPLAETVIADIQAQSPETQVRAHVIDFGDPWDFGLVYGALHDFARAYPFDPDREDYLVHITTGTHVAQICLFLLTESRYFPARLLQTSPPRGSAARPGTYTHHRSRSLEATTASPRASRRSSARALSFLKAGIETRNAAFNALIERDRAGRHRVARAAPAHRADRRRQVAAGAAHLRAQEGAAAGHGPLRRGQLRDAARRRRDVRAVRARARAPSPARCSDRPGLLRAADSGVLFLDEIGELGLDEQAMLLRAHRGQAVLAASAPTARSTSDFQLIAGTNRDLRAALADGPLPRRPARAHQPVDLPAARPARAAAKTSSRTSTTSWSSFTAAGDGT